MDNTNRDGSGAMAMAWITRIINNTDVDLTFDFTDTTWRPIVSGRRYEVGEKLPVPRRRLSDQTIQPIVWLPPIHIPAGPTILDLQYAFVGWASVNSKTRVEGPDGIVDLTVGPTQAKTVDYLKALDVVEKDVVEPLPVGPFGPGWVASMDVHIIFDATSPRIAVWGYHQVGSDVLQRFDELAKVFMIEVIKKLAQGIL